MKALAIWETFEKSGFLAAMRGKLHVREFKHPDDNDIEFTPMKEFIKHLYKEVDELSIGSERNDLENIAEEACDIANLCGFIYAKAKLSLDNNNIMEEKK